MAPEVIQNSEGYNEKVIVHLLNSFIHIESLFRQSYVSMQADIWSLGITAI